MKMAQRGLIGLIFLVLVALAIGFGVYYYFNRTTIVTLQNMTFQVPARWKEAIDPGGALAFSIANSEPASFTVSTIPQALDYASLSNLAGQLATVQQDLISNTSLT